MRRFTWLVVIFVTGAATLVACGGGDSNVTTGSSKRGTKSSTTTSTVAPKPTVQIAKSSLGPILVDENGFTLYQLDTDTATAVSCNAECATTWPPLSVKSAPVAGPGVDPSLLSTLNTGARQVTYAGHPLYRFSGDQAAGQTNGFGVGGIWWVLAADGVKIAPPPPPDTQPRVVAPPTPPPTEPAPAPPPPPSSPAPSYGY